MQKLKPSAERKLKTAFAVLKLLTFAIVNNGMRLSTKSIFIAI